MRFRNPSQLAQIPDAIPRVHLAQMLVEHHIALRRDDAVNGVRSVCDQEAMAGLQQTARIGEQSFGHLERTDVDHVDVEDVIEEPGQLRVVPMRVTVQERSALRLIPAPFGVRSLDVDEHGRTDVARRALGSVGSAAGQHSGVELRRLESDVREVRCKVGDMLAGAGGGVQRAEIRVGRAEQCAENVQDGAGIALGRLVGHFVGAAAGREFVMRHLRMETDEIGEWGQICGQSG